MSAIITIEKARLALEENGYNIKSIKAINEGSNHYVFDLVLDDEKPAICKFAKIREGEIGIGDANRDTLFGGRISLSREAYLFKMIYEEANVKTPKVYGFYDSTYGQFILIEKLYGISHRECMERSNYSKQVFLDSMYYLGRDFANVQKVSFKSFGNIMEESVIEPAGIDNFSDRFAEVLDMRLERCIQKNVFTEEEIKLAKDFFNDKLKELHPYLSANDASPVLVFTDMHAENFFTDEKGIPTGYFDLESAQAAPAALEFYGFRFFLFNFYNYECFDEAEKAFFKGYTEADGKYFPRTEKDHQIIDFLSGCRLLELAQSYWGHKDGIRDTWGEEMKALLFHYIKTNQIDYQAIGAIWRQRDKQPLKPLC